MDTTKQDAPSTVWENERECERKERGKERKRETTREHPLSLLSLDWKWKTGNPSSGQATLCLLFWFFFFLFFYLCVEGVILSHSYTFTNRGQRTGRQATRGETLDRLHAAQSIQWADRITRKPVTPDSIALVQLPSRHTMKRARDTRGKLNQL
jgi:hypothetical protein